MSQVKNKATILVTDVNLTSGIAVIRSLSRAGYRVIAADADPENLGFKSRHAHETLVYPTPASNPQGFVEAIYSTVKNKGVDLVIPVTDLCIKPLAAARELFAGLTKIAMPTDEQLDIVGDKNKTFALAQKLKVPMPKTYAVNSTEEALAKAEELGWPVVLKPQTTHVLHKDKSIDEFRVSYANTPERLTQEMEKFAGRCQVLLQRYIKGETHNIAFLMHEGQPLAAFEHKYLRECPLSGGVSAYRASLPLSPDLYTDTLNMLREINWTGLALTQYKVGEQGSALLEINGRVWLALALACDCGVDFPALLAQLYLEGAETIKPNLRSNYLINLRSHHIELEFIWIYSVLAQKHKYPFFEYPKRREIGPAFFSLFNPKSKFDLLQLRDPLPGLIEITRLYKKFRAKKKEQRLKTKSINSTTSFAWQ